MDEEAVFSGKKNHVSGRNIVKLDCANGEPISRPERGYHALAHGHEPQMATFPQDLGCQTVFLLIPGLGEILHARRLGAAASTPALELGCDFAAGQRHGFEDLLGTEFGFLIRLLGGLPAIQCALLFFSRRTVLLSHKNSTGPSFVLPQHTHNLGEKSVGGSLQQSLENVLSVIHPPTSTNRNADYRKIPENQ